MQHTYMYIYVVYIYTYQVLSVLRCHLRSCVATLLGVVMCVTAPSYHVDSTIDMRVFIILLCNTLHTSYATLDCT